MATLHPIGATKSVITNYLAITDQCCIYATQGIYLLTIPTLSRYTVNIATTK